MNETSTDSTTVAYKIRHSDKNDDNVELNVINLDHMKVTGLLL